MKCYVLNELGRVARCEISAYPTFTPQAAMGAVSITDGPFALANVIGTVDGHPRNYRVTGGIYSPRRARKVY